jgi:DNA polymerase III delta prime subunit
MNSSITSLLLHPRTFTQLQQFMLDPAHAIAITGMQGSGKKTLAEAIASNLLDLPDTKDLYSQPYFFHVARLKNKSDISIEQVREIINSLKLKVPGAQAIKRVVFIENAQLLSIPAQNKDHPLKLAVDEAKIFIKSTKYQRLLFVDRLSKSKENFTLFLDALNRTLTFLHHSAIKSSREAQSNNLLVSRKTIQESSAALQKNANSKLVALKLVLNLKI